MAAVGLLVVWMASGIAPAEARKISPKRECSICHVMWLKDFKKDQVATLIPYEPQPKVATGRQDVASTERMCFSCHDGYVLDSRFAWEKREHFHPVGVKPPDDFQIPKKDGKEIFPLNQEGKIYCGTCHSAHGVDWSEEYSPVFLRVENRDSSICLACHLDRSSGPEEGNHPVYKTPKEKPERLLKNGAMFGSEGGVICQSCHRVHGAADDKLLMVENGRSQLCGTCHADRYTEDRSHAARAGTHPVNVVPEAITIPEPLLAEGARLGSGGEIVCETCHQPHHAEPEASILVDDNQDAGLCRRCHSDKETVAQTKHDVTAEDESAQDVCGACHRAHNGKGPKMWAREPGSGGDAVASTCLSCHRDGGLAEKQQVGRHSHPVGEDLAKVENLLGLPGFGPAGVKLEKGGAVSCPTCHDPHQWNPDDPEKRGGKAEDGSGKNSFLRVSHDDDGKLCRKCHTSKAELDGSPHEAKQMVADDPSRKGLIGAGPSPCNACHRVHNGKGPRMWAMTPAKGEDPLSSLCKSCHGEGGAASGRTVGEHSHPVDISLSRLDIEVRDGEWLPAAPQPLTIGPLEPLPLFDAAGDRTGGMGAVTCATCHDPHVHAPKGGTGKGAFLRIPNDKEASLCRNCHTEKGQVARSKHNLGETAPEEENTQGVAASESHPCAACHLPHKGNGPKMWARSIASGSGPVSGLCRSCHQEGGVAGDKQVGKHSHPVGVDLGAVGLDSSLPLFGPDASREPGNGMVACATCHDPHKWDPDASGQGGGPSIDTEGDGRNSFLRIPSAGDSALCADCHEGRRWVRGTDHDLRVTAPDAQNAQGQSVDGYGVCSQCHVPHNAAAPQRLWARQPGPGQDAMESLCRSCHTANKLAQNKQPRRANHPPQVEATPVRGGPGPGKAENRFPVFDKNGEKARTGVISCPTCHNPHQWRPEKAEEGPGKNKEGDVRSSFLRNKSEFSLCTNCHGMDALFRYKYFHGESSRESHPRYR